MNCEKEKKNGEGEGKEWEWMCRWEENGVINFCIYVWRLWFLLVFFVVFDSIWGKWKEEFFLGYVSDYLFFVIREIFIL